MLKPKLKNSIDDRLCELKQYCQELEKRCFKLQDRVTKLEVNDENVRSFLRPFFKEEN